MVSEDVYNELVREKERLRELVITMIDCIDSGRVIKMATIHEAREVAGR